MALSVAEPGPARHQAVAVDAVRGNHAMGTMPHGDIIHIRPRLVHDEGLATTNGKEARLADALDGSDISRRMVEIQAGDHIALGIADADEIACDWGRFTAPGRRQRSFDRDKVLHAWRLRIDASVRHAHRSSQVCRHGHRTTRIERDRRCEVEHDAVADEDGLGAGGVGDDGHAAVAAAVGEVDAVAVVKQRCVVSGAEVCQRHRVEVAGHVARRKGVLHRHDWRVWVSGARQRDTERRPRRLCIDVLAFSAHQHALLPGTQQLGVFIRPRLDDNTPNRGTAIRRHAIRDDLSRATRLGHSTDGEEVLNTVHELRDCRIGHGLRDEAHPRPLEHVVVAAKRRIRSHGELVVRNVAALWRPRRGRKPRPGRVQHIGVREVNIIDGTNVRGVQIRDHCGRRVGCGTADDHTIGGEGVREAHGIRALDLHEHVVALGHIRQRLHTCAIVRVPGVHPTRRVCLG
mmetsp:Transcript_26957/g.93564  ORF Transcript_26957/g.93564 Transcript_26957/m.93564 type:complete len:460 (+) Transcript_26957:792-2171(+)